MSYAYTDPKDPDDIDDFRMAWAARLGTGETITAKAISIVTGGGTLESSAIDGTDTVARISGGTAGVKIQVLHRITTSLGRQLDATGVITVKAR